jgi:pimeloyl-ACP methyl ester carboxylesterase
VSVTSQLELGPARPHTFELPGQPIAALQAGRPGDPAVLLVPGFTGSKEDFGPILGPLAAAGFHVTAIDLPGQYESPGRPARVDYTPDRLAEPVLALAAELGGGVRLLGHSFGGLVARAAVIQAPTAVASLVLLSSGPAGLGGERRRAMDELEPVLASAGLPGVYAAMQAVAEAAAGYVPPSREVAEFLERRFLNGSAEMLWGMSDALRDEPDRVAELAATGVPILVVHGHDDDAWPPAVQHKMAHRLGARYLVIPDAAHSAAVENPSATVSALVPFWR